jgi:hypothetical protein
MNTFRNYADYEIPLLQVLGDLPGGQGASREVKDRFGVRFDDRIPDDHRVYLKNVRETKWRNIVAWVRNGLINRGLMDSPAYGIWRVTDAGRAHLAQAGNSAPPVDLSPATQLIQAPDRTVSIPIEGRMISLSAGQVFAAARQEIARGLPPAAHDFHAWFVMVNGHQVGVKWLFGLATGALHSDFKLSQARRAFKQLGIAVHRVNNTSRDEAELVAVRNLQNKVTKAAFIERAHVTLERLLAEFGQAVALEVDHDRVVRVYFRNFSGCHYELWVHANSIELALHFQSSERVNYVHLATFLPHQNALNDALGEPVRIEKWRQGSARVFLEFPKPALSLALADEHAERLRRLITVTMTILRETFAGKQERPRVEARIETPTRAHAIIDTQIATVRDFLNGRADRPSDERLCDWVHLCYEYELYREGRDLFALVDPAQVN